MAFAALRYQSCLPPRTLHLPTVRLQIEMWHGYGLELFVFQPSSLELLLQLDNRPLLRFRTSGCLVRLCCRLFGSCACFAAFRTLVEAFRTVDRQSLKSTSSASPIEVPRSHLYTSGATIDSVRRW